jgi:predicted Zn-dependent protease
VTEPAEVPEWRRLIDRAKHLISLKRPEDARKLAARAVALAPGEARAIALEPTLDWPHRVRGYVFLEMKRYQDAVEAGQEAVRLAPSEAGGFNLLACALRLADRLEEAEAAAERLRELAPEWFVTYEVSADVAYGARRLKEAEQWARAGLRIEPGSGRLQVVLGRVMADMARFDEAADLVQQGVSNEPMDPWHRSSFESVRERRSNARFAARALILIFLGGSLLFGIEAVAAWRKQQSPQAYVMGCISVAAVLLSLLFLSWLPHGLGPTLRRLWRRQERSES